MKYLITGDFHIHKDNLEELSGVFSQILKHLQECEGIILLGDIFNNANPAPSVIKSTIEFLNKIPKNKIIYLISGNHDNCRSEFATCWIPSLKDFTHLTYSEKGIITTINHKTVNMMHMHVNESKLGPEDIKLSSISYTKYKEDILLLGHVHKSQVISDKPLVLHPGSPYYINFGERNDNKGIYIINIEEEVTYKFVPLTVIPMKQFCITEDKIEVSKIELDELDAKTKVKIIFDIDNYKPELMNAIGEMIKKYRNKFCVFKYHLNIIRKAIEVSREEQHKTINELLEEFCKKENTDPEVKKVLSELLRYDD